MALKRKISTHLPRIKTGCQDVVHLTTITAPRYFYTNTNYIFCVTVALLVVKVISINSISLL